jgi:hypothetical protein
MNRMNLQKVVDAGTIAGVGGGPRPSVRPVGSTTAGQASDLTIPLCVTDLVQPRARRRNQG